MKRRIRSSIHAIIMVSVTTGLASGGGLLVDFSPTADWVQSDAAGFVFANGAASPQTTPYTPGSQGYGQIYGESSISVQLQTFRSTDGALNPSTIRMISRGSAIGNLINDYATCEPAPVSSIPTVGLQLNVTGLESGTYDFTSLHGDTDNQSGVVDVQYSLDGGATWINSPYDNTPYLGTRNLDSALRIALTGLQVDAAHGLSIRYLAGGGLFGTAGATTNATNSNRLFPVNSFTVSGVSISTLVDAYWKGDFPDPVTDSYGVWAATNGSTRSNWATDAAGANTPLVPGSATTVRFSATGALDQGDMVLGAPMAVAGIVVNDAQDCLLNADGNILLLGAGGINLGANAALSIAPPLVLTANQTWTNPGDSALTVTGAVSGGASLTKEGAGTLTLTGATAYSGATLVKEGTMSQAANTTGLVTIEQDSIYRITGGGGQSGTFAGAGRLVLTGPASTKGNAVDARQMAPGATVAVGINGDWINSDSGSQWAQTSMVFEVVGSFDIGSNVTVQSAGMTGSGSISTRWGSGANNTLRFVGSGDYLFTGTVGRTPYVGGMAVVHNGSGTQTLAGNVYANNISIAADATLRFGDHTSATFQMDAGRTITNDGTIIFAWASDNTVAGPVSGTGLLVKDGDGAVALTNSDNPYTGTTTVLDGTLLVNGSLNGGTPVTVSPDGTLGGGGSITGAVTANGTIAPGAAMGAIGTLAVGPATISATGVLAADIDSSVLTADTLSVTGNLTIAAGATLRITEQAPSPAAELTLVTYTGAWNSGIFAGFPDDTPVSVSSDTTYTINYNDTADGLNAVTLTVVSTDPYLAWAAGFGLTGAASAKDADPDHDGAHNLLEFASDGQPASGTAGPRAYPLMHSISGESVLTYTVAVRNGAVFAADGNRQTAARDGVKYTVEASRSLAEWTAEVTVTELTGTTAAAVQAALGTRLTEPPLGTGWQWHTFRTDGGSPADPADFIRLKAESAR